MLALRYIYPGNANFGSLDGLVWRLTLFFRRLDADSGVKFEWGVSVDEGGVYERRFRLHKTAPSVRQETGHSVCAEQSKVQR